MTDLRELRLGIISGTPTASDRDGRRLVTHGVGRLLDELRKHFPCAKICQPILSSPTPYMDHRLEYPAEALVNLPPLKSSMRAQLYRISTRRILKKFAQSVDMLFVRLPFQIPSAVQHLSTPKVIQIVGNPLQVVRLSTDYRGVMRHLARGFAKHLDRTLFELVAEPHTRTLTNGSEMWERLHCQNGRIVVSSSLYESEMMPRANLDLPAIPKLLFVGYLRPEKGALTLIEAFEKVRSHRPISLTVVGGVDRAATQSEQQLLRRIATSPFASDIHIRGMVPFGNELFDLYRSHDLFILPSLTEGTPRTLIEARAFGCPAVATNVGGIPDSVVDGQDGLLVPPGDVTSTASAIELVLDDDRLRRSLISAGIECARTHSLERFVAQIAEELEILREQMQRLSNEAVQ